MPSATAAGFPQAYEQQSARQAGGWAAQKGEQNGKEPLFSFVNSGNLDRLVYLLRGEQPKTIATVMNYLPSEMAAAVLKEINPEKQSAVAVLLSGTTELVPADVKNIETALKTKIDYLSGGGNMVAAIVGNTDEKTQDSVLAALEKENPELAGIIKQSVVRLEILPALDTASLQLIIKQAGPQAFAQVLKTFPDDTRGQILSKLPSGQATRLNQEMELAKPFTAQRLKSEKEKMLALLRRMKDNGML
jgi:flagellar motor switch protein FliG